MIEIKKLFGYCEEAPFVRIVGRMFQNIIKKAEGRKFDNKISPWK